ncbi:MAG: LPS-assembly protein LptD, partial [Candidatus Aminicenantes bacterium]|nr:LPS-assembly protein LptD [Candidatus Aminicenantes bacterium]
MKRVKLLIVLLMIAIISPCFSAEKKPVILAEHFESSGDYIIYTGSVEFIGEKYKIFADFLKYNTKTKDIIAQGRVTMTSGDMSVSGGELNFNIKEMTGEMYDVQGMMEPSVSFSADKLIQVDKDIQKFTKMKFTSCTQLNPRWLISSRKGKIKKDKYIEMRDVVLKIKNIPVFYLPYLRYPVRDSKSTGFLFPVIGNSEQFGFFMKNSFFWNIKPNLDLNISYDHISKIGKGAELELRYLSRQSEGSIKFYYFDYSEDYKDTLEDGVEIDDRDYNININHLQKISFLDTKIRADVNYQSNPEFQSIFNKDYGRYNRSRFNSSISLTSSISNLTLSVSASRNETFYIHKNTSNIISKFPSISLNLKQQKLWKVPGYFTVKG